MIILFVFMIIEQIILLKKYYNYEMNAIVDKDGFVFLSHKCIENEEVQIDVTKLEEFNSKFANKFCHNCGTSVKGEFCSNCGARQE